MTAYAELRLLEITHYLDLGEGQWILHYAAAKNPLPMNGSRGTTPGAMRAASRRAAHVRNYFAAVATAARIPAMRRVRAELTWWVATRHVRDVDNLAPFEKRAFDGLVQAGVVPDDAPAYMEKPRAVIRHIGDTPIAPVTRPGFTLTVTRLDDPVDLGDLTDTPERKEAA